MNDHRHRRGGHLRAPAVHQNHTTTDASPSGGQSSFLKRFGDMSKRSIVCWRRKWYYRRRLFVFLFLVASQTYIFFVLMDRSTRRHHQRNSSNADDRLANDDKRNAQKSFPRWGKEGINFDHLLEFILDLNPEYPWRSKSFPEIPYVWDDRGVWVSTVVRNFNRTVDAKSNEIRVTPTELMLARAWIALTNSSHPLYNSRRWKRLRRATQTEGGFPLLLWYHDNEQPHCSYHNFHTNQSIPLFTTCAHVRCTHAIPFPNYKTILDSMPSSSDWDPILDQLEADVPWSSKKPQLVWRGSLTGSVVEPQSSPRYKLALWAIQHQNHPKIDVGVIDIPRDLIEHVQSSPRLQQVFNLTLVQQHVVLPLAPIDFGLYQAVLDLDGNSWSARFGGLLCLNSVVLKVEPDYVDYFFYRSVQPNKHYLPVKRDLSNLLELVEFAVDPTNAPQMKAIVQRANAWCKKHMAHDTISTDMLDVLEAYVSFLDRGSSSWRHRWMKSKDTQVFTSQFGMELLELHQAKESNREHHFLYKGSPIGALGVGSNDRRLKGQMNRGRKGRKGETRKGEPFPSLSRVVTS